MTKADGFIPAACLREALLPEVEPIPAECGPFVLMAGGRTLGVARRPSGNVTVMGLHGDTADWSERLTPAEAQWLRKALAKVGY